MRLTIALSGSDVRMTILRLFHEDQNWEAQFKGQPGWEPFPGHFCSLGPLPPCRKHEKAVSRATPGPLWSPPGARRHRHLLASTSKWFSKRSSRSSDCLPGRTKPGGKFRFADRAGGKTLYHPDTRDRIRSK